MADVEKIKSMTHKERTELFLNFDRLFTKIENLYSRSKGEAHKAYSNVLDIISDMAVEIVRCKNCKYFQTAKVNNKGFLICPASGMEITETDYCSYGERKELENG